MMQDGPRLRPSSGPNERWGAALPCSGLRTPINTQRVNALSSALGA